jgi:hypothetical protein
MHPHPVTTREAAQTFRPPIRTMVGTAMRRRYLTPAAALAACVPLFAAAGETTRSPLWTSRAAMPVARTEVAAATVNGRIAVVGGMTRTGQPSRDAWLYSPGPDRWRALPRLPVAVHHPMAAGHRGSLYVVGGYAGPGRPTGAAAVLAPGGRRWRILPSLPEARAAAAAAVAGNRLYVVGGVRPGGLARFAFFLDLRSPTRWRAIRGPSPREHLAAASLGGRVYALAGRLAGIDTNLRTLEVFEPSRNRWRRLPAVPDSRGGTGAAAAAGRIVSVGGEEPAGTIRTVWAYLPARRVWQRLPDLTTPRHGLGVAAIGGTVYAIAGGEQPGLFVSRANESLGIS